MAAWTLESLVASENHWMESCCDSYSVRSIVRHDVCCKLRMFKVNCTARVFNCMYIHIVVCMCVCVVQVMHGFCVHVRTREKIHI